MPESRSRIRCRMPGRCSGTGGGSTPVPGSAAVRRRCGWRLPAAAARPGPRVAAARRPRAALPRRSARPPGAVRPRAAAGAASSAGTAGGGAAGAVLRTAAGVWTDVSAAGRGCGAGRSGAACKATRRGGGNHERDDPGGQHGSSGPTCARRRDSEPSGRRFGVGIAEGVSDVADVAELAVTCARQSRAAGQRQLRLRRCEHRHRQRLLEDRLQSVEVLGGADQHQRLGFPVGLGEHRAQPADQIFFGHDGVIDRGLHRTFVVLNDQRDELFRFDDADGGGR